MPTPQEKLKQDLRRVRKLEELIQHPKLSDRGRSKLGSALRMQKVAVKLARKAMTAPDESYWRQAVDDRDARAVTFRAAVRFFGHGLVLWWGRR